MMVNQGGVTSAKGFKACGDHVGLKKKRKDMALLVSDVPANFAATVTTNVAKAAPIQWNQQVLDGGKTVKAVLINSGQANACTGTQGILNAASMALHAASALNCQPFEIVLASTGIIGLQIPMLHALAGIAKVASQLRSDEFAGSSAAEAILTTDSGVKQCATTIQIDGIEVTIGAMAKGSGMIHPNMATMLSFITTDIAIAPALLRKALKLSVAATYNMISVDGDTSTNDMVAILANGMACNQEITDEADPAFAQFCSALDNINCFLAKKISSDAEGVTKRIAVTVSNTDTLENARVLAKAVVSSNLVKSSIFAADANWGRIVAALGGAGIQFDPNKLHIGYGSEHGVVTAVAFGELHPDFSESAAQHVLDASDIQILIEVGNGIAAGTAWGCDMPHDSIRKASPRLAPAAEAAYAEAMPDTSVTVLYAEVG